MISPDAMRDYQEAYYVRARSALSSGTCTLLALCVASGKTPLSLWIASSLLNEDRFSHVVILVPSDVIRRQFGALSGKTACHSKGIVRIPEVDAPQPRGSRTGRMALRTYLSGDNGDKKLFVTSYAIFRACWQENVESLQRLGRQLLVVVDESHHVPLDLSDRTNLIGKAIIACRGFGNVLLSQTGTPFRTDGQGIWKEGDLVIERPLVDHMLSGYAPAVLESEVLTVSCASQDTGTGLSSEDTILMPAEETLGFQRLVESWKSDGRPKSILRIRCGTEEANRTRVQAAQNILRRDGANVIVAYGPSCPEYVALVTRLNDKSLPALTYEQLPDFVICVQRADEGLDLPFVSHAYLWGIPRSQGLIQQIIGRTMRLRHDSKGQVLFPGYPDGKWLTTSKATFIVGKLQEADSKHAQFLVEQCVYLSTFRDVDLLGRLTRIDDRLPRWGNKRAEVLKEALDLGKVRQVRELLAELNSIRDEFPDAPWSGADFEEALMSLAEEGGLELDRTDIKRSLVVIWSDTEDAATHWMEEATRRHLEQVPFPEAVRRAFEDVFDQCLRDTKIHQNLYSVPAEVMSLVASRLRERLNQIKSPSSLEEILNSVNVFRNENEGRYPDKSDRDPVFHELRFQDHDCRIRHGFKGIEARSEGLFGLLVEQESKGENWVSRLWNIAHSLAVMKQPVSAKYAVLSADRINDAVRSHYRHVPEMVYYPSAWKVIIHWPTVAESIELKLADRLGRQSRKRVDAFIARHGEEGLIRAVIDGSFFEE